MMNETLLLFLVISSYFKKSITNVAVLTLPRKPDSPKYIARKLGSLSEDNINMH